MDVPAGRARRGHPKEPIQNTCVDRSDAAYLEQFLVTSGEDALERTEVRDQPAGADGRDPRQAAQDVLGGLEVVLGRAAHAGRAAWRGCRLTFQPVQRPLGRVPCVASAKDARAERERATERTLPRRLVHV